MAATHLGKNTVGPRQLKRGSVGAAKIQRNAVSTPKIRGNAVTGAKVRDNSLTGSDIAVASLAPVPSALDSQAVGGQSVRGFFGRVAPDAAPVVLLDFGGVRLTGGCSNGLSDLLATNSSGEAAASVFGGVATPNAAIGGDLSPHVGDLDLTDGFHFSGAGTLETSFAGGRVTTVGYAYVSNEFGDPGCLLFGHALSG